MQEAPKMNGDKLKQLGVGGFVLLATLYMVFGFLTDRGVIPKATETIVNVDPRVAQVHREVGVIHSLVNTRDPSGVPLMFRSPIDDRRQEEQTRVLRELRNEVRAASRRLGGAPQSREYSTAGEPSDLALEPPAEGPQCWQSPPEPLLRQRRHCVRQL